MPGPPSSGGHPLPKLLPRSPGRKQRTTTGGGGGGGGVELTAAVAGGRGESWAASYAASLLNPELTEAELLPSGGAEAGQAVALLEGEKLRLHRTASAAAAGGGLAAAATAFEAGLLVALEQERLELLPTIGRRRAATARDDWMKLVRLPAALATLIGDVEDIPNGMMRAHSRIAA